MTRGERPMLRDSNIVFVAALLALSSVPIGVLVAVLNIESTRDLVVDVGYSPWRLLPVGIALLACAVVAAYALLTRAWISEMAGTVMVALVGVVATFSLSLFALAVAVGLVVHQVRNPEP